MTIEQKILVAMLNEIDMLDPEKAINNLILKTNQSTLVDIKDIDIKKVYTDLLTEIISKDKPSAN